MVDPVDPDKAWKTRLWEHEGRLKWLSRVAVILYYATPTVGGIIAAIGGIMMINKSCSEKLSQAPIAVASATPEIAALTSEPPGPTPSAALPPFNIAAPSSQFQIGNGNKMEIKSTVMAPMWPDVSAQFHQELITALRATTAPNKHVMFSLVSGADTDSQHIADSVWNDLTLLPED